MRLKRPFRSDQGPLRLRSSAARRSLLFGVVTSAGDLVCNEERKASSRRRSHWSPRKDGARDVMAVCLCSTRSPRVAFLHVCVEQGPQEPPLDSGSSPSCGGERWVMGGGLHCFRGGGLPVCLLQLQ